MLIGLAPSEEAVIVDEPLHRAFAAIRVIEECMKLGIILIKSAAVILTTMTGNLWYLASIELMSQQFQVLLSLGELIPVHSNEGTMGTGGRPSTE